MKQVNSGFVAMCAVLVAVLLAPMTANAAIDVSAVVESIKELDDPINKIGAAILGIVVILFGWAKVKSAIR